ncbi:hypothetical protein ACC723_38995, partial [Rhizobium ruizarguesonis]
PRVPGLTRALPAVDQHALEQLSRYPEVIDLADRPARVEKLLEACALPDYRRITPAQHADLRFPASFPASVSDRQANR